MIKIIQEGKDVDTQEEDKLIDDIYNFYTEYEIDRLGIEEDYEYDLEDGETMDDFIEKQVNSIYGDKLSILISLQINDATEVEIQLQKIIDTCEYWEIGDNFIEQANKLLSRIRELYK